MKVALVHELLTMRGGAERVFRIFSEMFPDAPIYTLLYDEKKLGDWFPKERVRTPHFPSSQFPYFPTHNHHLLLSQFPRAVESFDFSDFDLVLSSSSAFVHGIITNGKPKHLCYVHSPARYLWDRTHDVLERSGKGILGPIRRAYLERTFHPLRTWDAESAARPDALIAASKEVQRRIELYWRRGSDVIHPPVDDFWFQNSFGAKEREHPDYFLVVSTLAPYKRIDLAIEACNALHLHLKVIGEGPDRRRLEKLAGETIEFYGHRESDELRGIYVDAQAVLFPGHEDFGLVPLEAMATGTPIIAYRAGGALETVVEGETGEFFDEPTSASLRAVLRKFNREKYSREKCTSRAKEFSRERFESEIKEEIVKVMEREPRVMVSPVEP